MAAKSEKGVKYMTIDKAIEILNLWNGRTEGLIIQDITDALKLGIEALKRVKSFQGKGNNIIGCPLPGETKD